MKHARKDYEAIQPWPTKRPHFARDPEAGVVLFDAPSIDEAAIEPIIPEDEPVFILRAKDISAPDVVRYWCDRQEALGGDPLVVHHIRQFADEMAAYGDAHGAKVADTPHELLVTEEA